MSVSFFFWHTTFRCPGSNCIFVSAVVNFMIRFTTAVARSLRLFWHCLYQAGNHFILALDLLSSIGWSMNCLFSYIGCFLRPYGLFIALAEVRSPSLSLKSAFSIASFPTEQINLVQSASSWGSVIDEKSQVVASCQIIAVSSRIVSPGFLLISFQNLSRMMKVLGLWISSIDCWLIFFGVNCSAQSLNCL